MRRLLIAPVIGLLIIAAACSSDNGSSSSSTTAAGSASSTSSVVVSAANKAACDSLTAVDAAVKVGVKTAPDPAANAAAIKTYLSSLVAPLEAAKANLPAELQPQVDVLILQGKSAALVDATTADGQQKLGALVLAPSADAKAANDAIATWSKTNCGVTLQP